MTLSVCTGCGTIADRPRAHGHACQRCQVNRAVLLSTETDRERRKNGVSLEQWLDAPPPPLTRHECARGPRPCPAVRCRHQLPEGACSLDVADDGGHTLADVARILGVTRERVRQIEYAALRKLQLNAERLGLPAPRVVRTKPGRGGRVPKNAA